MDELNKLLVKINEHLDWREKKDLPSRQFKLWSDWTFSAINKIDGIIVQNETLKGQLQMREAQLRKMERWMELLGQDSTMAKNVPAQLLDDLTPQQQAKAYINNNQWLWLHCSERLLGKMERTAFENALNKS
jgi:hypothetical protein